MRNLRKENEKGECEKPIKPILHEKLFSSNIAENQTVAFTSLSSLILAPLTPIIPPARL